MTTHELARELLELPDLMVCRDASYGQGGDYVEIDSGWTEQRIVHYSRTGDIISGESFDSEAFEIIVII